MRRTSLLLLVLLLGGAGSHPHTLAAQLPDRPTVQPTNRLRSEPLAFFLSLAGTSIPIAIAATSNGSNALPIFAGLLVGPSLGHLYAGQPLRALVTTGIRTALLAVTVVAIDNECSDDNGEVFLCGFGAALLGTAGIVAVSIFDIVTAPASARKYNREHPTMRMFSLGSGKRARLGMAVRIPL